MRDLSVVRASADLGTGAGWSAIELARAYPGVRVDGYDNDEDSISRARRHASEQGVANRVDFEVQDISAVSANGPRYDLVTFFECLHDLAYPVKALQAARESLLPGGTVLVMDENIDEVLNVTGRRSATVPRCRQRHLVHASRPYR